MLMLSPCLGRDTCKHSPDNDTTMLHIGSRNQASWVNCAGDEQVPVEAHLRSLQSNCPLGISETYFDE